MKRWLKKIILAIFLATYSVASAQPADCARIISLAPSITGILKALGLSSNILAISRYDKILSAENKNLTLLGGYLDLKLEAIVALNPSLIIGIQEHATTIKQIEKLGFKTILVNHNDLKDFFKSIKVVSTICGVEKQAFSLEKKFRSALSKIKKAPEQKNYLLLSAEQSFDESAIYTIGKNSFLSDLLEYYNYHNWLDKSYLLNEIKAETLAKAQIDKIFVITTNKDVNLRSLPEALHLIPNFSEKDLIVLKDPFFYIPGYELPKAINFLNHHLEY